MVKISVIGCGLMGVKIAGKCREFTDVHTSSWCHDNYISVSK